jgi:hypothetical protein
MIAIALKHCQLVAGGAVSTGVSMFVGDLPMPTCPVAVPPSDS